MPRFHFHQRLSDGDFVEDREGMELPDLDAARREAVMAAREIISDLVMRAEPFEGAEFQIADESGRVLTRLPFELALARRKNAASGGKIHQD